MPKSSPGTLARARSLRCVIAICVRSQPVPVVIFDLENVPIRFNTEVNEIDATLLTEYTVT